MAVAIVDRSAWQSLHPPIHLPHRAMCLGRSRPLVLTRSRPCTSPTATRTAVFGGTIPAAHPIYLYCHDYAYCPTREIGRRGRVVYVSSATLARGRSRCLMRGTALFTPSIHLAQGFSVQFLAPVSGIGIQLDDRFPSSLADHYPPVNCCFCSPPIRCVAKPVGWEVRHIGVVAVQWLVTLSSP